MTMLLPQDLAKSNKWLDIASRTYDMDHDIERWTLLLARLAAQIRWHRRIMTESLAACKIELTSQSRDQEARESAGLLGDADVDTAVVFTRP